MPTTDPAPVQSYGHRSFPVRVLHQTRAVLVFFWETLLRLAVKALPFAICIVLLLLAISLLSPPVWYFSIYARTDSVALELPREHDTNWRIEGAILCSTAETLGPLHRLTADEASPCGAPRWFAYVLPGADGAGATLDEQVLILGGDVNARSRPVEVAMETRDDGGLQISLRSSAGDLGLLRLTGLAQDIPLPSPLNLIWGGRERPRDLVFPFTATQVRVGRDVTWSDAAMLREGRLAVFTGTDELLAKRALIEQVDLLPGDQVRLEQYGSEMVFQPKGFLRFERHQTNDDAPSLTAIAFGRAESVKIERFGDSGYDFRPGWWVGILHDRRLVIWSAIMLGMLTVLGAYSGTQSIQSPSLAQAWSKLREHWRSGGSSG